MHRGAKLTEYDLEPRFRGQILALPARGGDGAAALIPAGLGQHRPSVSSVSGESLSVEENEKRLLREALLESRGNRTKAAQLMGISRRTLHRKLAQWSELDVIDH